MLQYHYRPSIHPSMLDLSYVNGLQSLSLSITDFFVPAHITRAHLTSTANNSVCSSAAISFVVVINCEQINAINTPVSQWTHLWDQSTHLSLNQSTHLSIIQSTHLQSQSINTPVRQINTPVNQNTWQSINQHTCQVNQHTCQSTNQHTCQSTNQHTCHSITTPVNRSINTPVSESINTCVSQSISIPVIVSGLHSFHHVA